MAEIKQIQAGGINYDVSDVRLDYKMITNWNELFPTDSTRRRIYAYSNGGNGVSNTPYSANDSELFYGYSEGNNYNSIQVVKTVWSSADANNIGRIFVRSLFNGNFTPWVEISGKVTGPSSATNNAVAIFDGTGGKTIKNSGFTIGKSVPSDAVFTDTWRPVQDNLTSTSTTDCLSANQGKVLNDKKTNYDMLSVNSHGHNDKAGWDAAYALLPTQYRGNLLLFFKNNYNLVVMVNKYSATYGSMIGVINDGIEPYYYCVVNGTSRLDNLALNSNLTQKANYSVPTISGYAPGLTSHNLQARRVGNVIFLSGYFKCIEIANNSTLFVVSGIDVASYGVVEQYQGRSYSVRIANNGNVETNENLPGNTYYVNLCIPVSGN